jgi:hypothetical protein
MAGDVGQHFLQDVQHVQRALWQAGMARLGALAVGLDGVVAQQDNYRCGGLDLRGVPLQQLLDCDRPCFPSGRADFLRAWVHQPGHHVLGLLHQGRLAAYGVMRPCLQGHKIGPLIAGGAAQAQALLGALMARAPEGGAVFLDVPQPNAAAVALAEGCGMAPMFELG